MTVWKPSCAAWLRAASASSLLSTSFQLREVSWSGLGDSARLGDEKNFRTDGGKLSISLYCAMMLLHSATVVVSVRVGPEARASRCAGGMSETRSEIFCSLPA